MVLVVIQYNENWLVTLMFEPKATHPTLNAQQLALISVVEGQEVRTGDEIGYQVVGAAEGPGTYPPHLSYGVIYKTAEMGLPTDSSDCSTRWPPAIRTITTANCQM